MQRSIYLRPVGAYAPPPDAEPDAGWSGLPLAGGPLAFSAAEVLERGQRGTLRRMMALADLCERDWERHTLAVSDLIERIRLPRPPLSGLSVDRPRIMGIVNVTPDSFSDGGRFTGAPAAIDHALRLADEGADILDIGGELTRPGSDPVSVDEELRRVMPVFEGIRGRTDALISIDTRKAEVMRRVAAAGADILNDVSALTHDPAALDVAAESGLPVILMHAQGDPKTMNDDPQYTDVVLDVFDFLERRIAACERAGIPRARLVADPGIGFGKHLHHNVAVLSSLSLYHGLGVPLLLGASKKKLIGELTSSDKPKDRTPGSLAAALFAIGAGVQMVRVHDVAATRQAIGVWTTAVRGAE